MVPPSPPPLHVKPPPSSALFALPPQPCPVLCTHSVRAKGEGRRRGLGGSNQVDLGPRGRAAYGRYIELGVPHRSTWSSRSCGGWTRCRSARRTSTPSRRPSSPTMPSATSSACASAAPLPLPRPPLRANAALITGLGPGLGRCYGAEARSPRCTWPRTGAPASRSRSRFVASGARAGEESRASFEWSSVTVDSGRIRSDSTVQSRC